jgi:hypothetical protein
MSTQIRPLDYNYRSSLSVQKAVSELMTGSINSSLPITEDPGIFLRDNLIVSEGLFKELSITQEELQNLIINHFNRATVQLVNEFIEHDYNHDSHFLFRIKQFQEYSTFRSLRDAIQSSKHDIEEFNLIDVKINCTSNEFIQLLWLNLQRESCVELSHKQLTTICKKRKVKPHELIGDIDKQEYDDVIRTAFINLASQTHQKYFSDVSVSNYSLILKMNRFYKIAGTNVVLSKVKRGFDENLPQLQADNRQALKVSSLLKLEITPEHADALKEGSIKAFKACGSAIATGSVMTLKGAKGLFNLIRHAKDGEELNQYGQASVSSSGSSENKRRQEPKVVSHQANDEDFESESEPVEEFVSKARTVQKPKEPSKQAVQETVHEVEEQVDTTEEDLQRRLEEAKQKVRSRKQNQSGTGGLVKPVSATTRTFKYQQEAQKKQQTALAEQTVTTTEQPSPQVEAPTPATQANAQYFEQQHLSNLVHSSHTPAQADSEEQTTSNDESVMPSNSNTQVATQTDERPHLEDIPFEEVLEQQAKVITNEDKAVETIINDLIPVDDSNTAEAEIEDAIIVEEPIDPEFESVTEAQTQVEETEEQSLEPETKVEAQVEDAVEPEAINLEVNNAEVNEEELESFSAKVEDDIDVSEAIFAKPESNPSRIDISESADESMINSVLEEMGDDFGDDETIREMIANSLKEDDDVEALIAEMTKSKNEPVEHEEPQVEESVQVEEPTIEPVSKGTIIIDDLPESETVEETTDFKIYDQKAKMTRLEVMKYLICFNEAVRIAKQLPAFDPSRKDELDELYSKELDKVTALGSYLGSADGITNSAAFCEMFKVPALKSMKRGKAISLANAKLMKSINDAVIDYQIPMDLKPTAEINPLNASIN